MKTSRMINTVLLAGLWIGSVVAWSRLPALIPTHFSVYGNPDHWSRASARDWFATPAFAVAMSLFIYWMSGMVSRRPGLDVRKRTRFDALPVERKQAIAAIAAVYCGWLSVLVTLEFIWNQLHAYQTAMGVNESAWFNPVQIALLGVAIWMIIAFAVRAKREGRRQVAG
jgi:uncharacterized membrane protein